jgi:indole-3-glycerol phosphate synthase
MSRNARGVLQPIVAAKEAEIDRLRPHVVALRRAAEAASPARPFEAVLRNPAVQLIAEFKRRSPSAGWLRQDARVADIVPHYEAAGAAALSVLTDREFFGGSLADLEEARKLTKLPVLRKDFLLDELQMFEARAYGADAALLIVRLLDAHKLRDLLQAARALGLGVLVETHNAAEIELALDSGASVIGVNNRDLSNFATNLATVLDLVTMVPPDVTLVAESGIRSAADVARLGAAGIDAVLVGEAVMSASDPGGAVAALTGHVRTVRREVPARA